ncbi:tRNA pseudouridine synthase-like 1 isoform X5 [Coregonus clupeaformis]|uniref:tRNA pseudouridine synthase-like 1 isoform X5 n=1 Tax=Coregonus clupeaformis TaxID=59861 RepID=UPI001BE0F5FC|nr:tRNA pseudouridine synthase-like 1 isoform X5 [Coregonus clupeaformis]
MNNQMRKTDRERQTERGRGIERLRGVMKAPPHHAVKGVQNYLEDAVRSLKPENEISLSISSRTDTGVHALGNSAHFDLQRQNGKPPFSEEVLVDALNFHLRPEPIRITRAYRVPGGFHARFRAVSRTYVYRLAAGVTHHSCTPLTDANLCWGLRHTDIQFWELTFKSRSFLYKQVRRMTGALVAVGQGQMSVSGVKELLEAQDSQAYPHNLTSPPEGLFLTRVEYHRSDLQPYTQEDSQS